MRDQVKAFLCVGLLLSVSNWGNAADLRHVSAVTNQVIELYFVDGHIDFYGDKQRWDGPDNRVYYEPLDRKAALVELNYSFSSGTDADFRLPVNPSKVDLKSRIIDVNSTTLEPRSIYGHWVYLRLPKALEPGNHYELTIRDVAGNLSMIPIDFTTFQHRSVSIHVNQVGFAQVSPKVAYLSTWTGTGGGVDYSQYEGKAFSIVNVADGSLAFTGSVAKRGSASQSELEGKNLTNADVWECDFSRLEVPGEYVVAIEGMGCSHPFEINDDICREAFWYAMKGLFFQRGGIDRELEPGRVYKGGHQSDRIDWCYTGQPGHEVSGWGELDCLHKLNPESPLYGFYHDAGDWDSYISHRYVPFYLMLLYDLAPDRFHDGDVGNRYKLRDSDTEWIDEGTNGLPDILDEAGWLPASYRRLRRVLIAEGLCDGGVPEYIGREGIWWGRDGAYGDALFPSWDDPRAWAVQATNAGATASYAAMAAWYASCLNLYHSRENPGEAHPEAAEWITEAREAYAWARPREPEHDILALAAACLYRATGDASYGRDFATYRAQSTTLGYGHMDNWTWVFHDTLVANLPADFPGLDTALQQTCRDHILRWGDSDVHHTNQLLFRVGTFSKMHGQLGTPRFQHLAASYFLTKDPKYLAAMQHSAAYYLGGNQRNKVLVTCLGEDPDNMIFHPDAWIMNDFNHQVYHSEPFPGYCTYYGQDFDYVQGPGAEQFVQRDVFPEYDQWPEFEKRSGNRESISGNEFTVHQNNIHLAYAFGALRAACSGPGGFTVEPRPRVALRLKDGHQVKTGALFTLRVSAASNVRRIQYYCGWRYLGESTNRSDGFSLDWHVALKHGERAQITAVAYNHQGRISLPSDRGQKIVVASDTSEPLVDVPAADAAADAR